MSVRRIPPKQGALMAVGVLLLAAFLVPFLLLFPLSGPSSTGDYDGAWLSRYWEGWVRVDLRADGTYHETIGGFSPELNQSSSGQWTYSNGRLTLRAFLAIGGGDDTYVVDLELQVYRTVLRGTHITLDLPSLDFHRSHE